VIVVVGDPVLHLSDVGAPSVAVGRAAAIARACVRAGASVQLAGKVGDDPAGDEVLMSLTRDGVGHVALLRDVGLATRMDPPGATSDEDDRIPVGGDSDEDGWAVAPIDDGGEAATASALVPEDLDLALRYLTSFAVLIVAEPLSAATLAVAVESAAYSGAHLIHIGAVDGIPPVPADDMTVLEPPPADPGEGFAALVGRYAAELDGGARPAAAFRTALGGSGWEPAAP
jgi:hypothetical protein